MATTFRTDIRAGMLAVVQSFATANPTMLAKVHKVRPTTFAGDIPFAYIDLTRETASHTAGTRERVLSPSVVVVAAPLDNDTQVAAWDTLVDALADHFTDNPQFTANTIWDVWTVTDESEEIESREGTRTFPAVRFTFGNVSIREGRS